MEMLTIFSTKLISKLKCHASLKANELSSLFFFHVKFDAAGVRPGIARFEATCLADAITEDAVGDNHVIASKLFGHTID